MNVFDFVLLDPVNYYILYSLKDIKEIKKHMSKDELDKFILDFAPYNLSYRKEKRSVVEKKSFIEGILHNDYVSLATYYWPNPKTKDGLPYISLDGKANPEGNNYDKQNLRKLAFISYYQVLLYFLSEDHHYLDLLEDNWTYYFLDKNTGMNPNMNHAQLIKGVNLGRGIGMIDFTANISYALKMMKLLKDENLLSHEFSLKLDAWLEKFVAWYCYSPLALEERYANNNHGTFYDFGLIVLLDYLDKKEEIYPLVCQMIELRMKTQIKDDIMPLERKRTKAKSYSLMGIKGIYDFSYISSQYGYDLYQVDTFYHEAINKDIKKVCLRLYQELVTKEKEFLHPQITPFDESTLLPLIYEISKWDQDVLKQIKHLEMKNEFQYHLLENLRR